MEKRNLKPIDLHKVTSDLETYCEMIRDSIFKDQLGCYLSFELEEDFYQIKLKSDFLLNIFDVARSDIKVRSFRSDKREMEVYWFWDADGTLIFKMDDGDIFYNDDCKKDYGWKPLKKRETMSNISDKDRKRRFDNLVSLADGDISLLQEAIMRTLLDNLDSEVAEEKKIIRYIELIKTQKGKS